MASQKISNQLDIDLLIQLLPTLLKQFKNKIFSYKVKSIYFLSFPGLKFVYLCDHYFRIEINCNNLSIKLQFLIDFVESKYLL